VVASTKLFSTGEPAVLDFVPCMLDDLPGLRTLLLPDDIDIEAPRTFAIIETAVPALWRRLFMKGVVGAMGTGYDKRREAVLLKAGNVLVTERSCSEHKMYVRWIMDDQSRGCMYDATDIFEAEDVRVMERS
jgi:hypothetical protein